MMRKVNHHTQCSSENVASGCKESAPAVVTLFRKNPRQFKCRNSNSLCDLPVSRRGRRRTHSKASKSSYQEVVEMLPPACFDKESSTSEGDLSMSHEMEIKYMRLKTPASTMTKIYFGRPKTSDNFQAPHHCEFAHSPFMAHPPAGFVGEDPNNFMYPFAYHNYMTYCPTHSPMNYYMGSCQCHSWNYMHHY